MTPDPLRARAMFVAATIVADPDRDPAMREVEIVDAVLVIVREHQGAGIDRAAREIASLCAGHASDLYVPGTDHLAAIIRREMGVGER